MKRRTGAWQVGRLGPKSWPNSLQLGMAGVWTFVRFDSGACTTVPQFFVLLSGVVGHVAIGLDQYSA